MTYFRRVYLQWQSQGWMQERTSVSAREREREREREVCAMKQMLCLLEEEGKKGGVNKGKGEMKVFGRAWWRERTIRRIDWWMNRHMAWTWDASQPSQPEVRETDFCFTLIPQTESMWYLSLSLALLPLTPSLSLSLSGNSLTQLAPPPGSNRVIFTY